MIRLFTTQTPLFLVMKFLNKYLPVRSSDQPQREIQQQSQILCRKTKGQEGLKDDVLCLGHHSIPSKASLFLCDLGPYLTSCYFIK